MILDQVKLNIPQDIKEILLDIVVIATMNDYKVEIVERNTMPSFFNYDVVCSKHDTQYKLHLSADNKKEIYITAFTIAKNAKSSNVYMSSSSVEGNLLLPIKMFKMILIEI